MDAETILMAAWKSLAANPECSSGFPRGFWPDLARVSVEMALQGTLEPVLDFRPTKSGDVTLSIIKKQPKKLSDQLKERVNAPNPASENPFERF